MRVSLSICIGTYTTCLGQAWRYMSMPSQKRPLPPLPSSETVMTSILCVFVLEAFLEIKDKVERSNSSLRSNSGQCPAYLVDVLGEVVHGVLVDEPQRLAVAAVAGGHLRECVALHLAHS